jgi:ribosomal protein S18 acetylase RimI-like enzyme
LSRPVFSIRHYRANDAAQLEHLYARVGNPYRPEDEAEVLAMRRRALQAMATNSHWSPMRTDEPHVTEAAHLAFWVAVTGPSGSGEEIIGSLGLRIVGDAASATIDTADFSGLPSAGPWINAGDVGEVRRLRVAPEWRRRGVATALTSQLIAWAGEGHRLRTLVLNTTAAQGPALALYRKFGFHELERTYLGSFELVWMQRMVRPTDGVG